MSSALYSWCIQFHQCTLDRINAENRVRLDVSNLQNYLLLLRYLISWNPSITCASQCLFLWLLWMLHWRIKGSYFLVFYQSHEIHIDYIESRFWDCVYFQKRHSNSIWLWNLVIQSLSSVSIWLYFWTHWWWTQRTPFWFPFWLHN